jgi:hypothetical protein
MSGTPGMWAFIGIDPGITSGIAWATYTRYINRSEWDVHAASCDGDAMIDLMMWRISVYQAAGMPLLLCAEKFVDSNRRPGKQSDHDNTRAWAASSVSMARRAGVTCAERSAADVKPFCTDKRLEKIGFPLAPKLKDARDAGRHMLFGAIKSGRADDPLL